MDKSEYQCPQCGSNGTDSYFSITLYLGRVAPLTEGGRLYILNMMQKTAEEFVGSTEENRQLCEKKYCSLSTHLLVQSLTDDLYNCVTSSILAFEGVCPDCQHIFTGTQVDILALVNAVLQ